MTVEETTTKWIYRFSEGDGGMRDLLGGKGAGLAEMTRAALPVPPGFTITTEACNSYYEGGGAFPQGMWDQVLEALRSVEGAMGRTFGSADDPLLVSVRSGASVSMPGMMDTVLNLGLNEQSVQGIARVSGDDRFAFDSYRRFIQMFGRIVLGVDSYIFESALDEHKRAGGHTLDTDLTAADMQAVAEQFLSVVQRETGRGFPQDPFEQLELAIRAVFASWNGRRAIDYRNHYGIPHDLGTAVSVVAMVFGNMGEGSGTGVAFSRDPATGDSVLYGEFLTNAQGEDVVAGIRTPLAITEMDRVMPDQFAQLVTIAQGLERHYRDAQDMEFTIERGTLYMLQTRSAKRTAQAAVKMAVDMVNEGLITREEAVLRVEPDQIYMILLPRFDEQAKAAAIERGDRLAIGLNASPGAASGQAVFTADRAQEMGFRGESVILVRPETNPDDVHGMLQAKGVLTARGGATSHAAVVARGLGKPCVAGVASLIVEPELDRCRVDGRLILAGEEISIDGATGEIFAGPLPTVEPNFAEQSDLVTLLEWANSIKRLGVWANADYPRDAERALEFGAEGIGLCRTEHMFFEEERLPIVRQMILKAGGATRLEQRLEAEERVAAVYPADEDLQRSVTELRSRLSESEEVLGYHHALETLLGFQIQDFRGILRAMDGKPVIIRLLDPPLHEFLPRYEDLLVEVTTLRLQGIDSAELAGKENLLSMVDELREMNPMLGLRGCRLGLLYGAINHMQARAIFTAAAELVKEGLDPRPEIMVPLVGMASELRLVRQDLEGVRATVEREQGLNLTCLIGTMIELPRAALTADEIAHHADFFSFGTNDLTQTTFGFSRDDAESKFLRQYVQLGILPENPFQILDRGGVGKLITMAISLGHSVNPDLSVGICGEHGGDPSSIEFCHQAGLDYVSASPYRIPVARLAAAHAALAPSGRD